MLSCVRALVDDKRVPKHLRDALEDSRATADCRAIAVQTDEGVKIICLDCNIDGMSYNIDNLRYSHFRSSKHMNADPFRALHLLCSRSARSDSSATAYARTFGTGVTPLTTAEDPAWGSPLDDKEAKLRQLVAATPCLADDSSNITKSFGCQCKFYRATDQSRLLYTLNSPDPDPVEAEQIIAVVEMQFQAEEGLWKVTADTVEMLDGLHEAAS